MLHKASASHGASKKLRNLQKAYNRVSQLVANIACLKDHFKVWCEKHQQPFTGDTLINTNRDVAVVHDLWNWDKHGVLNQSRSGLYPRFPQSHSTLQLTLLPRQNTTGKVSFSGSGVQLGEGASLKVTAEVVDKDGNLLGMIEEFCARAVAAWEAELKKAGVGIS